MATCEPNSTWDRSAARNGGSSGRPRSIRGGHVQLGESLSLRLSDAQPAMHTDQMSEAKLTG